MLSLLSEQLDATHFLEFLIKNNKYILNMVSQITNDDTERSDDRKVWFDRIVVHEHPYELGDNPSVTEGAPLTISWKQQYTATFDVGYYEIYRPSSKRRTVHTLRLSVSDRARLLLESGYTIDDIVQGSIEASSERQSRVDSVKGKKWDGFHEAIETTSRTLKKVARRGSLLATAAATAPVRMGRRASLATAPPVEFSAPRTHRQQSRRRHSVLGAQTAPEQNSRTMRRNSLLASTPTTEYGMGKIQYAPENSAPRRRRNSLLGTTPTECGMGKVHHTPEHGMPRRRRNSLLGTTPTECGMASDYPHSGDHGNHRRRNSLIGAVPVGNMTGVSHQPRRRRNSLLGTTPTECGVVGRKVSMCGAVVDAGGQHTRRSSLLGDNNKPVCTRGESNSAHYDKSRRRNSLFGSAFSINPTSRRCHNRRASLSNGLPTKSCSTTRRNSMFGSTVPLTDSDACIIMPKSA